MVCVFLREGWGMKRTISELRDQTTTGDSCGTPTASPSPLYATASHPTQPETNVKPSERSLLSLATLSKASRPHHSNDHPIPSYCSGHHPHSALPFGRPSLIADPSK